MAVGGRVVAITRASTVTAFVTMEAARVTLTRSYP